MRECEGAVKTAPSLRKSLMRLRTRIKRTRQKPGVRRAPLSVAGIVRESYEHLSKSVTTEFFS